MGGLACHEECGLDRYFFARCMRAGAFKYLPRYTFTDTPSWSKESERAGNALNPEQLSSLLSLVCHYSSFTSASRVKLFPRPPRGLGDHEDDRMRRTSVATVTPPADLSTSLRLLIVDFGSTFLPAV